MLIRVLLCGTLWLGIPALPAQEAAPAWLLRVEGDGHRDVPLGRSCKLDLVASGRGMRFHTSLKPPDSDPSDESACWIQPDWKIVRSGSSVPGRTVVVFQAIRYDAFAPTLQLFHLDATGFLRRGEVEIVGPDYVREGVEVVSVTGQIMIETCFDCDSRPSAKADISVPVRVDLRASPLVAVPTITREQGHEILSRFLTKKDALSNEINGSSDPESVKAQQRNFLTKQEQRLRELLSRQ